MGIKHKKGWLVGLASAPTLSGPWKRLPRGNPVLIEPVFFTLLYTAFGRGFQPVGMVKLKLGQKQ